MACLLLWLGSILLVSTRDGLLERVKGIPDGDDSKVAAVFTLGGFAVQQAIEFLDLPLALVIKRVFKKDLDTEDAQTKRQKKTIFRFLSFGLGLLIVLVSDMTLLGLMDEALKGTWGDVLITALVIGSGTEGVNILQKYLGHVKEFRKATDLPVEVVVMPSEVAVNKGETFHFEHLSRMPRIKVSNGKWHMETGERFPRKRVCILLPTRQVPFKSMQ